MCEILVTNGKSKIELDFADINEFSFNETLMHEIGNTVGLPWEGNCAVVRSTSSDLTKVKQIMRDATNRNTYLLDLTISNQQFEQLLKYTG